MSNKPPISWSSAAAAMRKDRIALPEIREERLRTTAHLRGTPAVALNAWRGRSGRRYVCGIHELAGFDLACVPAVCLAVTRDEHGEAINLSVRAFKASEDLAAWLGKAGRRGASEIHVHGLAESPGERAAIVADLSPLALVEAA